MFSAKIIKYEEHTISFQTFLVWALKIIVESRTFRMLLLYILWDDRNFYDFRFKGTATAAIGIHPTKAWLPQLVNFKIKSDTWEERYAIKLYFKLGKMPQKHMECFRMLLEHLAWIEHQFLSSIRDSRKAGSLWWMMRGVGRVRKSIDQSWLAKELGLGVLCWSF